MGKVEIVYHRETHDSEVYHAHRICSGTVFSREEMMDRADAARAGIRPCPSCTPDEWQSKHRKDPAGV